MFNKVTDINTKSIEGQLLVVIIAMIKEKYEPKLTIDEIFKIIKSENDKFLETYSWE